MKNLYAQTFTLLLLSCLKFTTSTIRDDDLYVIRSTAPNGLVLDGTNHKQINVEFYTGFSTQLWSFKPGSRSDLYYIINNHTGEALDFVQRHYPALILNERRDSLEQQWTVNMDGTIRNAGKLWNIDIKKAQFVPGTDVGIWKNNGCECQKFVLQRKV